MAIALAFISLLIVARLRSYGAPVRRVTLLVVELWGVFALWMSVLWAVAARIAPEGGIEGAQGLHAAGTRFSALGAGEKALLVASVVLGLAVFAHFQWSLRSAMAEPRRHIDEG